MPAPHRRHARKSAHSSSQKRPFTPFPFLWAPREPYSPWQAPCLHKGRRSGAPRAWGPCPSPQNMGWSCQASLPQLSCRHRAAPPRGIEAADSILSRPDTLPHSLGQLQSIDSCLSAPVQLDGAQCARNRLSHGASRFTLRIGRKRPQHSCSLPRCPIGLRDRRHGPRNADCRRRRRPAQARWVDNLRLRRWDSDSPPIGRTHLGQRSIVATCGVSSRPSRRRLVLELVLHSCSRGVFAVLRARPLQRRSPLSHLVHAVRLAVHSIADLSRRWAPRTPTLTTPASHVTFVLDWAAIRFVSGQAAHTALSEAWTSKKRMTGSADGVTEKAIVDAVKYTNSAYRSRQSGAFTATKRGVRRDQKKRLSPTSSPHDVAGHARACLWAHIQQQVRHLMIPMP